jgi:hypothetical protein
MKYRMRPLVVDAVQWTGDNLLEVTRHLGNKVNAMDRRWEDYVDLVARRGLEIQSLRGRIPVNIGDYIINDSWYSVVDPATFKKLYELVEPYTFTLRKTQGYSELVMRRAEITETSLADEDSNSCASCENTIEPSGPVISTTYTQEKLMNLDNKAVRTGVLVKQYLLLRILENTSTTVLRKDLSGCPDILNRRNLATLIDPLLRRGWATSQESLVEGVYWYNITSLGCLILSEYFGKSISRANAIKALEFSHHFCDVTTLQLKAMMELRRGREVRPGHPVVMLEKKGLVEEGHLTASGAHALSVMRKLFKK